MKSPIRRHIPQKQLSVKSNLSQSQSNIGLNTLKMTGQAMMEVSSSHTGKRIATLKERRRKAPTRKLSSIS